MTKSAKAERKEARRLYGQRWSQSEHGRERNRINSARWRANNKEKRQRIEQRAGLKRHYGLTLEAYEEMLSRQKGACAICRNGDPGARRFAVDHDHATGTVRGLLCSNCNTGLGLFSESPYALRAAIEYLLESRA